MSTTIDNLIAAQGGNPARYWVNKGGKPGEVSHEELEAMVQAGYTGPVMLTTATDGVWKTAADFGVIKAAVAVSLPNAPAMPPSMPEAAPVPPSMPAALPSTPAALPTEATPIPTTTTTVAAPAAQLPSLVTDPATALALFSSMGASSAEQIRALGEVVEHAESSNLSAHTLPFTQLKDGSWQEPKSTPQELTKYMPAGKRDFFCIYLAHRIGALGWQGAGGNTSKSNPPLWRFALPSININTEAPEVAQRVLDIANKIQFTKAADKAKYDGVGRLTPELHVLVWTPGTGPMILSLSGYKPVVYGVESFKALLNDQPFGRPLKVSVVEHSEVNKRVQKEDPTAKNAAWTIESIEVTVSTSESSMALFREFEQHKAVAMVELANALQLFLAAADYRGLTFPEIKAKIAEYGTIP